MAATDAIPHAEMVRARVAEGLRERFADEIRDRVGQAVRSALSEGGWAGTPGNGHSEHRPS